MICSCDSKRQNEVAGAMTPAAYEFNYEKRPAFVFPNADFALTFGIPNADSVSASHYSTDDISAFKAQKLAESKTILASLYR